MNKPIFTGPFCAFTDADHAALSGLVRRVLRPGCRIAEVGSWIGNGSTQSLLLEASKVEDARVLCVDTWAGSFGVQRHQAMLADYDVLGTFRHNTAAYADRLDILVADSVNAAKVVADSSFDLVFIDGDHRYAAVKADLAAWHTKVKLGGILCGHDCECRPTPEIREMVARDPNADCFPVEKFKFAVVHAGSIVAVDEFFTGGAELMSDKSLSVIWSSPAPARYAYD